MISVESLSRFYGETAAIDQLTLPLRPIQSSVFWAETVLEKSTTLKIFGWF